MEGGGRQGEVVQPPEHHDFQSYPSMTPSSMVTGRPTTFPLTGSPSPWSASCSGGSSSPPSPPPPSFLPTRWKSLKITQVQNVYFFVQVALRTSGAHAYVSCAALLPLEVLLSDVFMEGRFNNFLSVVNPAKFITYMKVLGNILPVHYNRSLSLSVSLRGGPPSHQCQVFASLGSEGTWCTAQGWCCFSLFQLCQISKARLLFLQHLPRGSNGKVIFEKYF